MGWLANLLAGPKRHPARPVITLAPSDGEFREVVGESFYQDHLEAICGGRCEEGHERYVPAALVPEPTNRHDPCAVRVVVAGLTVAYLSRGDAQDYHHAMARHVGPHSMCECVALLNGGWARPRKGRAPDLGHFGVELDVAWPPRPA